MSVFTEDVLQGQGRIFEVLRVLPVEEWSLLLLFIFLWCMTWLYAAYVLVLGKIGQVSDLLWGYGMLTCPCPGAHCHPPMGKIKKNTSPNPKLWTWLGKSSIPWRFFLTKNEKKSKDLISSMLDNQMVLKTERGWHQTGLKIKLCCRTKWKTFLKRPWPGE